MSAVKGLSGFIVGLGVGGATLTGVAAFIPQIEELAFLKTPEAEQSVVAEEAKPVEPVAEIEKTTDEVDVSENTSKSEEVVEDKSDESTAEGGTDGDEKKEEASEPKDIEIKNEEIAVVDPETKDDLLETEVDKVEPEAEPEQKKVKLPTIEPEIPSGEPDVDVVEEPVTDEGITIGKKPSSSLPSISSDEPEKETSDKEEKVVDGNALEFNAVKFESSDRPLMGVILEDIGAKGLDIDKLKALNAPITIAIRTDASDASERALAYQAAGFEVIAMAPKERNAALNLALNPNQVKDALNVLFTSVPNAVGLIDNPLAKLQKNSRTSDAVVDSFVETGHGLITYAKGLNSVDRSAQSKGVKASKVSRILDKNSENKALMARYLDRISLDAGRDGRAIVLGTTAKETVAALAGWVLSSKGQSVTIAPASAVLLGK